MVIFYKPGPRYSAISGLGKLGKEKKLSAERKKKRQIQIHYAVRTREEDGRILKPIKLV